MDEMSSSEIEILPVEFPPHVTLHDEINLLETDQAPLPLLQRFQSKMRCREFSGDRDVPFW
jgi:hypothetical protein